MTSSALRPRVQVAARPAPAVVLLAVMRAEWTKLRTVRSTIWALIFTVVSMIGVGTLLTALEISRWDHRSAREALGFDPLLYSFGGMNLAQLSIGVLGVLVMTSEYGTRVIKLTISATPQRRLLLVAKIATFSCVVAVVSLVSCLTSFAVGQQILASRHAGVSITDPGVLRAILGAAGYLVLVGAIGVGIGAILRHTAGAVAVLFAVLLVVPGLVTLLPSPWNDNIEKYLPGSAGTAMASLESFPNLLAPGPGLLVLVAYTAAIVVGAGFVLQRRDA
ncbi:MAG: ABC transporter permease [Mycobacteriales bacterium]